MKQFKPKPKPESSHSTRVYSTAKPQVDASPFAALAALRDTLPPGSTPEVATTLEVVKPTGGTITIQRSSKGHGGKTVTTLDISQSTAHPDELLKLCKTRLGCGGALEQMPDRTQRIILQGDVRDRVESILTNLHYRVKRSGG